MDIFRNLFQNRRWGAPRESKKNRQNNISNGRGLFWKYNEDGMLIKNDPKD